MEKENDRSTIVDLNDENAIQLSDTYYLKTDRLNYILCKKGLCNGKEIYQNVSYHGTLDSLYRKIVELEIRDNPTVLENMKKSVELIETLANQIKNLEKTIKLQKKS